MRYILTLFLIHIFMLAEGQQMSATKQEVLNKFGFEEYHLFSNSDTISFYFHKKKGTDPQHLVLYLQGSNPDPLFVVDKVQGEEKIFRWFPGDFEKLDSNYSYAVIAKAGIPALLNEKEQNIEKYHKLNTLDHRVFQADTVINFIRNHVLRRPQNIIVYGHSEGASVAAKLGTINKNITHLGFWAGNALPDYFDFILFNCKASWMKKISQEESYQNIQSLLQSFKEISQNPEDTETESKDSYSNKRWWSYAEPPLNNLLKIDIPIFVQVAALDESAPIESTYMIPLEFIRLGKSNLTFDVCLDCDHGFEVKKEDEKNEDKWGEIFQKFMNWTKEN